MSCLRDILNLFGQKHNPFYAGFGNRFTDALSYRSVNIPSNRIFTINSNAEVSLDLLTLNKYKSSYVTMREVVDHFFPPVGLLVKGGGEEFTDFNYWRDAPLELDDFSASESEDTDQDEDEGRSIRSEDEGSEGLDDDEQADNLGDSFISRDSIDEGDDMGDSMMESIEGDYPLERSTTAAEDDFLEDITEATDEADVDRDALGDDEEFPVESGFGIDEGRKELRRNSTGDTVQGVDAGLRTLSLDTDAEDGLN